MKSRSGDPWGRVSDWAGTPGGLLGAGDILVLDLGAHCHTSVFCLRKFTLMIFTFYVFSLIKSYKQTNKNTATTLQYA